MTHLEEVCRAVADDAVPFHFAKSKAAISGSTLHGLPGQYLDRPPAPRVDLIVHHVLQALVVGGVQEDLGLQLAACVAVVHHLHDTLLEGHENWQ